MTTVSILGTGNMGPAIAGIVQRAATQSRSSAARTLTRHSLEKLSS